MENLPCSTFWLYTQFCINVVRPNHTNDTYELNLPNTIEEEDSGADKPFGIWIIRVGIGGIKWDLNPHSGKWMVDWHCAIWIQWNSGIFPKTLGKGKTSPKTAGCKSYQIVVKGAQWFLLKIFIKDQRNKIETLK